MIATHSTLRYMKNHFPKLLENVRIHSIDIRSKFKRKDLVCELLTMVTFLKSSIIPDREFRKANSFKSHYL